MNQLSHQESGTANLQDLTPNPGLLLTKSSLWIQLSCGDLIIMPLIMVMFRFTLNSFHFNLTLNLFQIHTPLQLNKFMMIKWIISWNSSTQNMMTISWMLTSRCFRLDWCLPLLHKTFTVSTVLFHK